MPSHRADTPADAPVALRTRASAHPPEQRRRDLRARGTAVHDRQDRQDQHDRQVRHPQVPAPVDPFPAPPAARRRPTQRPGALDWLEVPAPAEPAVPAAPVEPPASVAALALDPFPAPRPTEEPAGRREALPSRRSLRDAAAKAPQAKTPQVKTPQVKTPQVKAPRVTTPEVKTPQVTTPEVKTPEVKATQVKAAPAKVAQVKASQLKAPQAEPAPRRGSALGLPQVGIAGALGIATIAVPLSGAFAVAPAARPSSASAPSVAAALQPLPPFPLVAPSPATALDDVRLLPDQTEGAAVPARLAAPRVVLANRASRSDQRAVLPGCDGHVPDVTGVQNGRLPASMLCTLWDPNRQLRSDAAVAIAKLNLAYKAKFGHPVCFNDAYRSLTAQYRVKAERGGFAARPGTSEHGWGLAVDLCDGVDNGPGSATYQWMRDNAPTYGWFNPKWALSGGAGPYEPWHWEYFPGEKKESSGD